MKTTKFILKVYKGTASFLLEVLFGNGCRFTPTCSVYMAESIEKHGGVKGSLLGLKRLSKCHPLTKPAFDPVPSK